MIKLFLILIVINLGYGYPDGAPNDACMSMMPGHNIAPKQCQPKYIIEPEKYEYDTNGIIRITVRGSTNIDSFKGILLTAKSQSTQQIIGTWSTIDPLLKKISCNGTENNAISHSSSEDKLHIEALWHAPSSVSKENMMIEATIVTSFHEIYVNCFNVILTVKKEKLFSQSIGMNTERNILDKPNTNITLDFFDDILTVKMIAGLVDVGQWRAIGFSLDQNMGNEYVFICQIASTGVATLRRMHTEKGARPPSPSNATVNVIHSSYENGYLTCEFSFGTTSEQFDGEPAPITIEKDYYITFAAGFLRTEAQIAKHNFTFVTPTTYQLQNSEIINLDELNTTIFNNNTSTSAPSNGTWMSTVPTPSPQTNDVGVNISWTYANGVTTIKMLIKNLRASQWLAMGLSLDEFMGEDHVFICQHLNNNTISLQRFITPNGHSPPVLASTMDNPGGTIQVTLEKHENGFVYCEFTLSNFANTRGQSRLNNVKELSQTTNYQPLIAIGNLNSLNKLMKHSDNSRTALSKTVFLNRQENIVYNVQSIASDSTGLMKAHGIIMVFTWIVLVSTGILIARYFKQVWPDKKICGKAVWFAIHRTIMSCAAISTLVAFILILVYKKGQWVPNKIQPEFSHSIVGMFVISFAIIQPFMALFRCNPDDQYRFIFNYAHATIGFSAFILSIVTMFLALFFTRFQFHINKEWTILVVWSCWLPCIFVAFELIELHFRKYSSTLEKTSSFSMNELQENKKQAVTAVQSTENQQKTRIKMLLLLLHIILAFTLAIALIVVIGKSENN